MKYRFEYVFDLYNDLQSPAMNNSVFCLSQTSLLPVHRPQTDVRVGWPGREVRTKNLESECAQRPRRLSRQRFHPCGFYNDMFAGHIRNATAARCPLKHWRLPA